MPLHQFPKHSQRSAPGTVKDLEELGTIAVPRDNASGFCCVSLGQMAARMAREGELSRVSAVTGLLASLSMPEF